MNVQLTFAFAFAFGGSEAQAVSRGTRVSVAAKPFLRPLSRLSHHNHNRNTRAASLTRTRATAWPWTRQQAPELPPLASSSQGVKRRKIVAGNWKLNPTTRQEAVTLLQELSQQHQQRGEDAPEVVVFPPLTYLSDAICTLQGTGIKVGAQNAGSQGKGAFTGEIAPSMLASAGCEYVLLGHSERRTLFKETDEDINHRMKACLEQPALSVILCVGETLQEYEAGLLKAIVDTQLRKGLAGIPTSELESGRIIIAYEPVWAIGTGLVATPDQAQAAHEAIRATVASMHSEKAANSLRIQYGGSVSPDSASSLMSMPDVDGALVGGASLKADSFTSIVQGALSDPLPPAALTKKKSDLPKVGIGSAAAPAAESQATFAHCSSSYFALENLTPKGPRKNADIGNPHDASRPLVKMESISAGAWWCAQGGWTSPTPRTTTEVFYVFSGHGCVTDKDGTRHFMGPGDLVVLPKGWAGRWDVLADIHKVWFVTDHPDADDTSNPSATVRPYNTFAPQYLQNSAGSGGIVSTESSSVYANPYMEVGCSTVAPGTYPVQTSSGECFHVLEGLFFLTNSDGSARRCVAGDTVCLPKNWSGSWDVLEPVKKLWVDAA